MRPVELAFRIVELIGAHQPVGVSELARLTALPKSTTQRTLQALRTTGWIAPAEGERGLWRLTPRAMVACGRPTHAQAVLRAVALPVMEELRRATEETIHLTWLYDDALVLLERLDGIRPVRYFFVLGGLTPLHGAASGQAMLAAMAPEAREAYLSRPLARLTAHTLVDADALRARVAMVQAQGYAVTVGGNVADVTAVGAAIIGPDEEPIGAISVSAPSERIGEVEAARYGPLVADGARRIGLGLQVHAAGRHH